MLATTASSRTSRRRAYSTFLHFWSSILCRHRDVKDETHQQDGGEIAIPNQSTIAQARAVLILCCSDGFKICLNHFPDHLHKCDSRVPIQPVRRISGISLKSLNLHRSEELIRPEHEPRWCRCWHRSRSCSRPPLTIYKLLADTPRRKGPEALEFYTDLLEGSLYKLPHGTRLSTGEGEVFRSLLPHHEVNAANHVLGVGLVSFQVHIARTDIICDALGYPCGAEGDLARDEGAQLHVR